MISAPTFSQTNTNIAQIRAKQKAFFASKKTLSYEFRKEMLLKLKAAIQRHEKNFLDAVFQDLHKPEFEAWTIEVGLALKDIDFALKNLKKWMNPKRVPTQLFHAIGASYIYNDPYGQVLLLGPWNYPIQLILQPLVGIIAAGNTAVVKPSEISANCSAALAKMIKETFSEEYIAVVEGGIEPTQQLLAEKWDYIFFTGSVPVGKIVYEAAAKHLTPVTLELGGKSPCIVDEDIHLANTVKRLLWGKYINCGQTCVAPDYVYVHQNIKEKFIAEMKKELIAFYGENPQEHNRYGRIINDRNFQRLSKMIEGDKVIVGGKTDAKDRYIAPTLMEVSDWNGAAMQEEIFGPILPIFTYNNLDEVIQTINAQPKPLAFYIFSNNEAIIDKTMREIPFGGGGINETVMHLGNHNLPFGGVGDSGIGAYHGQLTFDTFSHKKGVMRKSNLIDLPIRYPFYKLPLKWLKLLVEWLL